LWIWFAVSRLLERTLSLATLFRIACRITRVHSRCTQTRLLVRLTGFNASAPGNTGRVRAEIYLQVGFDCP
jgi:hypothetical protein